MTEHHRQKAEWEKAVDQGLEIINLIDEDISEEAAEQAAEFFEDVRQRCGAVIETIERMQHVTEKQQKALDGWERGVRAWIK